MTDEFVELHRNEALPDEVDESLEVEDDRIDPAQIGEIVTYTLDWSVQSLLERIGRTLDINPSFQRRDAWTVDKKSLYIESLMLGLPVPQIVLAEDPQAKGRFIVLDGKQRLLTMKQFAAPDSNFKSFKLRRLAFLNDVAFNMSFTDMQASLSAAEYAESLLVQPIRTIVVRNWQNPAILFNIFVRLNQGSLSLSPQELRQALYPSEFTTWINSRSAGSNAIHEARGLTGQDFRMRDAEMLLRFIAFKENLEQYAGNLRAFLDSACSTGQAAWRERGQGYFETLASTLEATINRTFEAFGRDEAFRRFEGDSYNRRFNIAVYDLMTLVLSDPKLTDELFESHRERIKGAYEDLCRTEPGFQQSLQVSTKTIPATAGRLKTFGTAIEAIIGEPLEITARADKVFTRGD